MSRREREESLHRSLLAEAAAALFAYSFNMGAEGLWPGMLLANVSFGLLGLSWFYHGFSRKLLAVSSA